MTTDSSLNYEGFGVVAYTKIYGISTTLHSLLVSSQIRHRGGALTLRKRNTCLPFHNLQQSSIVYWAGWIHLWRGRAEEKIIR